ncbi:hypothetical protein ABEB36_003818 [Hypothenemus hampei]|uniref:THAP-type domain-containing protein n=1 Tax=Hypothenemus hampei TaxID=57062 RepID=A0ABD1F1A2_HYPHA
MFNISRSLQILQIYIKMPGCCITQCKNSSKKGYKLYLIPNGENNTERREQWVRFINRSDLTSNSRICEAHFSEKQYEQKRQDKRKKLKNMAYPDILVTPNKRKREEEDESQLIEKSISHDYKKAMYEERNDSESQNYSDIVEDSAFAENLSKNDEKLNIIKQLRNELKLTKEKLRRCKKKLQEEKRGNINTFFNTDQMEFLKRRQIRGSSWSEDTLLRALKLYMACGTTGYNEIRKQHLPYPSIRTLQYHIQAIKLNAGICEEVFKLLELKIQTFTQHERHAVLIFDEMAIKSSLQFDTSLATVVGYTTLNSNKEKNYELANYALVYMIAGISTRWKQIVGYDLTCNSFRAEEIYDRIFNIIKRCHEIGLYIVTVITDMGPNNQSLWKKLNIGAGKFTKINNYINHPYLPQKKLYFMPDSIHVFKNLAIAFTKHYKFILQGEVG